MELQRRRKPKMCRTCLTKESTNYISIFKSVGTADGGSFDVSKMITECTSIKPTRMDKLPNTICQTCIKELCQAYLFRQKCLESDKYLRIDFFNCFYVAKILNETVIEEEPTNVHDQHIKTNTTEYLMDDDGEDEQMVNDIDEVQSQDEIQEENGMTSLENSIEDSHPDFLMKQERISEQFEPYDPQVDSNRLLNVKSVDNYMIKSRNKKAKTENLDHTLEDISVYETEFQNISHIRTPTTSSIHVEKVRINEDSKAFISPELGTCKNKCFTKVSENERAKILAKYAKLPDYERRVRYLRTLVEQKDKKSTKINAIKNRAFTFEYRVEFSVDEDGPSTEGGCSSRNKVVKVCKFCFLKIFQISPGFLRTIQEKIKLNKTLKDMRGRSSAETKMLPAHTKERAITYINSVKDTNMVIKKMYRGYLATETDQPISISTFYKIFKEINTTTSSES